MLALLITSLVLQAVIIAALVLILRPLVRAIVPVMPLVGLATLVRLAQGSKRPGGVAPDTDQPSPKGAH